MTAGNVPVPAEPGAIGPNEDDMRLLAALRAGSEDAFRELVARYHAPLLRLARFYVSSQSTAEDVVQETWLGVLQGLGRFEGRASLKTWIFRILMNRARTRAVREGRSIPFSALGSAADSDDEPAVDPARFIDEGRFAGHWASRPRRWDEFPEERIISSETRTIIQMAIDQLPPNQREVITLRDVEGWTSAEVCNVLEISETNQRVLLHRARSKVRRALELYFDREEVPPR